VKYISTRGGSQAGPERLGFEEVMLAGLARDGGLYIPESWPQFSKAEIAALKGKPYVEVAFQVMRPFVGDTFDEPTFRRLIREAYASFETPEVAPLKALGDSGMHLLELFHGSTTRSPPGTSTRPSSARRRAIRDRPRSRRCATARPSIFSCSSRTAGCPKCSAAR
jgi:hypothetical protein